MNDDPGNQGEAANATAEHVQPVMGEMLPECFHVTSFRRQTLSSGYALSA